MFLPCVFSTFSLAIPSLPLFGRRIRQRYRIPFAPRGLRFVGNPVYFRWAMGAHGKVIYGLIYALIDTSSFSTEVWALIHRFRSVAMDLLEVSTTELTPMVSMLVVN